MVSWVLGLSARWPVCALVSLLAVVAFRRPSRFPRIPRTLQGFDAIGTSATAALPADFRLDRPSAVAHRGDVCSGTRPPRPRRAEPICRAPPRTAPTTSAPRPAPRIGRSAFCRQELRRRAAISTRELVNNTATPLCGLQIAYNVEKYRGGIERRRIPHPVVLLDDGVAWTAAGADFTTAFRPTPPTAGFASAPGQTVAVNKPLNVAIPPGAAVYLAWNYSVASGTTTTNAQALAIDDIAVTGHRRRHAAARYGAGGHQHARRRMARPTSPVGSTVVVNFSESVNAVAARSRSRAAACRRRSASARRPANSFTLTPAAPLPYTTTCTVTVTAAADHGRGRERSAGSDGRRTSRSRSRPRSASARGDQRHHQRG